MSAVGLSVAGMLSVVGGAVLGGRAVVEMVLLGLGPVKGLPRSVVPVKEVPVDVAAPCLAGLVLARPEVLIGDGGAAPRRDATLAKLLRDSAQVRCGCFALICSMRASKTS